MGSFVGREPEIAILDRSLSETDSGKGGVVLVSGEPGIGKTALLDLLSERAEARRFRVLRALCAPHYLQRADSPWTRIARMLAAPPSHSPSDSSRQPDISAFSSMPDKTAKTAPPAENSPDGLSSQAAQDAASYLSLQQLFEDASRQCPLLLTLDDLHNADEPLLGLLRFASHALRGMRVLLVAAYSSLKMSVNPAARSTIQLIAKHTRCIELTNFEPLTTGQLLAQIAGNALDEATMQRVHDLTGGNAALILETAFGLLGQARRTCSNALPERVPGAIRAVIEEKLDALSAEARGLLGVASAIGETFASRLLLSVASLAGSTGLAALSESESAGFIRPLGRDRFRFVMGFVRRVLYEDLTAAQRTSVHRQIAAALQADKNQNMEVKAGDVALHLLASRDADAIEQALELAQLAASHSAGAGDYQSAVIMYSIALEAIALSGNHDEARRCDTLIALGKSQDRANDIAAAQESLYEAAEIAQRLGDGPRLADVVLAAPIVDWPSVGEPNGLVITLAEKVLDSLPESESTRRVMVIVRLAAELTLCREQREHGAQLATEALNISKTLKLDAVAQIALMRLREHALRSPQLVQDRLTNSSELIRLARRQGDWIALFEGEWARKLSLFQLGALDGGDAGADSLEHAAIMAGSKYRCFALAFKSILTLFDGRFVEGEELLGRCREMALECGIADQMDQLWTALIMPLDEQERLSDLEAVAARGFRTHRNSIFPRAMWCWFALRMGNRPEARFHLDRLAAQGFRNLTHSSALLVEAAALTEVCAELGDTPQYAATLYEILLPHADHNAVCGPAAVFGAVSRYLGKLALMLSRLDRAVEHFSAAVDFNKRIGARAWTAHASHELAVALMTRGHAADRRMAVELLADSHAEAATMGMKRLARSIQASMDRLDGINRDWVIHNNGLQPRIQSNIHCAESNADHSGLTTPHAAPMALPDHARSASGALECEAGKVQNGGAVFRLEQNYWTLAYAGRVVRLKRLKGLALIAYLLSRPNQEVHALELARSAALEANGVDYVAEGSDLGPILDYPAKQAYRQRLGELREELEEARSFNDFQRAGQLEEELCIITRELARAVGLGGRDRRPGSATERSRLRVTSAIRWATSKISKQHPALGRFLALNIKTGAFCSYVPDPQERPHWDVQL